MTVSATIPIAALGRLNAHARACVRLWDCGLRDAIYTYKSLAAMLLIRHHGAWVRFVKWRGKCNRCDGGRFTLYDHQYRPYRTVPCQHCDGLGNKTLRFTETLLEDGQVWHHPWEGRTSPGRSIAQATPGVVLEGWDRISARDNDVHWQDANDWQPNRPSDRLLLEVLVTDLNAVEDWVEGLPTPAPGRDFWWIYDSAHRCLHQQRHRYVIGRPSHSYKLDLGLAPGGCYACGTTEDLENVRLGRMTPLFHWTLSVCKAHHASTQRPEGPPPEILVTPTIRRWLDRHERVETVG